MDAGQVVRESRRRAGLTQRRLIRLVRAAGLDLDVRVVPLDEDAWTMVERGAAATPDERLDRAIEGVSLLEEGRRFREGDA